MRLPKAVLFDNDGVLVASEPLHWAAWELQLREMGLPYDEDEVRTLVGKTAPQIMAILLDRHRPGWTPEQYDLNQLALRKNDHYLSVLKGRLKPYPGVREGLEWLRARGIRTAVVSNARRRELCAAVESTGLAPLLDAVVSRDDAGVSKPDPGPYLMAAASVGADPALCLAVEDSPPGIEAALVGKIPAAAVLTNFTRETMSAPVPGRPDLRPVHVAQSMTELFEWIRTLPGA